MTYLSGKAQKRKVYTRYALMAGILFLVVFFWPFVKKNTYSLFEPIFVRYGGVKESFTVFPEFFRTYVTSHKDLISREKELEVTIEQLENQLAEKDALLREGDGSSVSSSSPRDNLSIVAYPLMQDMTRMYSTVLLSKGFKDGVEIGDTVYLRGRQIVCTIKEVYTSSSLCLLLSSSGVTTDAVTSSSSITLSLVGRGGYYLADIVRDTPVLVGEKVYLKSDPSMVIGTVRQVANNNQDTSWHVFVEGAYNPITSSIFYVQP